MYLPSDSSWRLRKDLACDEWRLEDLKTHYKETSKGNTPYFVQNQTCTGITSNWASKSKSINCQSKLKITTSYWLKCLKILRQIFRNMKQKQQKNYLRTRLILKLFLKRLRKGNHPMKFTSRTNEVDELLDVEYVDLSFVSSSFA